MGYFPLPELKGKPNRIFVDGKTLNQIAKESGIRLDTVQHRYSRGIAFSSDRDEFGILAPYIPCGGKRALQSILDAGGFCSFDGMEYVQELGA